MAIKGVIGDSVGFATFALDHPQHIRTIRAKIEAIRKEEMEWLVLGSARDWAEYQRRVGKLEGLRDALFVCDEIEKAARA